MENWRLGFLPLASSQEALTSSESAQVATSSVDMISLSALLLGDPDAATIVQTFPKATVSDLKRTLAAELIGSTLSTRESNLLKLYNVEFENLLSSDARLRNADCVVEDVFPRAVLLDPFKTVASSFNGDLVQSDGRFVLKSLLCFFTFQT